MPTKARIAVLGEEGSLALVVEDVEFSDPRAGQVIIRNVEAGTCDS